MRNSFTLLLVHAPVREQTHVRAFSAEHQPHLLFGLWVVKTHLVDALLDHVVVRVKESTSGGRHDFLCAGKLDKQPNHPNKIAHL